MARICAVLTSREKKSFHGESGISNLTLKLAKVFGKKSQTVFKTSATPNQIEEIPPSMYLAENELSKKENHHQNSYWKYALAYCGLFVDEDRPKGWYVRVTTYWHAVGQMTNEDGVLKYPQLFALAKAILSLSHGNVVPERRFLINKYLLSVHENSIKEDTIVALRLVKDELCLVGGLSNFKITRSLMVSVKVSYIRYQAYLDAEKKVKVDQERKRKEEEQREEQVEKEKTKCKMNQDISFPKECIK